MSERDKRQRDRHTDRKAEGDRDKIMNWKYQGNGKKAVYACSRGTHLHLLSFTRSKSARFAPFGPPQKGNVAFVPVGVAPSQRSLYGPPPR